MKRVVMIIAQNNFRDEELFDTKLALESLGVKVDVAALSKDVAIGSLGGQIKPDHTLAEIDNQDYSAIVFVGGQGAYDCIDNQEAHRLVLDFQKAGKIVAAICIAPSILAKTGLLKGKKMTMHESGLDFIGGTGADYTGADVERDGNLITASGPAAASMFGQEIAKALNEL